MTVLKKGVPRREHRTAGATRSSRTDQRRRDDFRHRLLRAAGAVHVLRPGAESHLLFPIGDRHRLLRLPLTHGT